MKVAPITMRYHVFTHWEESHMSPFQLLLPMSHHNCSCFDPPPVESTVIMRWIWRNRKATWAWATGDRIGNLHQPPWSYITSARHKKSNRRGGETPSLDETWLPRRGVRIIQFLTNFNLNSPNWILFDHFRIVAPIQASFWRHRGGHDVLAKFIVMYIISYPHVKKSSWKNYGMFKHVFSMSVFYVHYRLKHL